MDDDLVHIADVEVIAHTGLTLVCLVRGQRVMVPLLQIDRRSTVARVGDRGILVLPRWVAQDLGLA